MSVDQTEPGDLEQYRTSEGVSKKEADLVSEHPLKHRFGDDKERKYDAKQAGTRFVDFYDDPAAAIREFLSNAETACVRRARAELRDAGYDVPDGVREVLEKAEANVGYEAQIEVSFNRSPQGTTLIIEDNGIGINPVEYDVLRRVGYSASHGDGNRLGQFGIGFMSGFLLCGTNGGFRLKTNPYGDYDAYSTAEYLANFEYLSDEKQETGTRFEFPTFKGAAQNIDVPEAVRRYSEGMQVTVLYRDFDDSGKETGQSDEFLPTFIEDNYPDNELVVTYEDEYFKAVMSPADGEHNGQITFNVTMPIKRNCGPSYKSNPKFDAQWKWDFRAKKENGPIVHCESDPSIEGLVPIEDTKYQGLGADREEDHVPMSDVPDDAIRMPKPASSRDSYKGGNDEFWQYVSEKLEYAWADIAAERFEELDTWQDFVDLYTKAELMRAFNNFIGYFNDPDPTDIQDKIKETFDTDVDEDVCEKLHMMQSSVKVLKQGHSKPHIKAARTSKKLWKIIDEYGENVYTGKSVSKKKAEIVWGLDAAFVRVEDTSKYDEYEQLFGWEPAKKLPNRKLSEKLPNLDPDVADKWENKSTSSSSSSSGRTSRDPTTKRIKLRYGTRSRSKWTKKTVSDVVDALENDEVFWSKYSAEFRYLVILDQTKDHVTASKVAGEADKSKGIAAVKVPKYVFKYLKDKPNVYGNKQAAIEDNKGTTIDVVVNGSQKTVNTTDLTDDWLFILTSQKAVDTFDAEDVAETLGYDPDDYKRITMLSENIFSEHWGDKIGAEVVKTGGGPRVYNFDDYNYVGENFSDLQRSILLDSVDETHKHYEFLFGDAPTGQRLEEALEIAEELGMT